MKVVSVTWTLAGLGAAALIGAVVWPNAANSIMPGSGERAAALRAYLPTSVAAVLPTAALSRASAQPAPDAPAPNSAPSRPPAPVTTGKATRGPMPFVVNSVGTAQPIATVALKTRADAQIEQILAVEGGMVKAGDIVAKLDARQIEAQIKQAEAMLTRDTVALEAANRDVARYTELLAKNAGTKINLDNAKTAAATAQANMASDRAQIDNLKIQLTWYTIKAPISGRVGSITVKAGNIVRAGDNTTTGVLATIVQTTPIYVAFSLAQHVLPDLRESIGATGAEVLATPQGSKKASKGKIAFIDNTIDPTTGTVTVRASFDNEDEALWPGQLCNLRMVLRIDQDVVSIPRDATQSGQNGNFVYVVENGIARIRPVKIGRTQDGRDIILDGLKGDETLVVEGALALSNGARVVVRNEPAKKDS
ncbi:efflux RND transporter periplasmic adaptor subunit [Roseiarcaceae bacterium H3SJ34-1]|uniref:efflux RND transporter periplasmic adaptor subunit n=1 Tax=Terripilifer ovatus TaxID=3032367 RepID=UPI003AB9A9B7|nr:efflux RND transporter periplasmic adaptor subunit [Roseiarcaceae bacterium H3SJ34-1]